MQNAVQKIAIIITTLLTEIQNICVNHVEINQRKKNVFHNRGNTKGIKKT